MTGIGSGTSPNRNFKPFENGIPFEGTSVEQSAWEKTSDDKLQQLRIEIEGNDKINFQIVTLTQGFWDRIRNFCIGSKRYGEFQVKDQGSISVSTLKSDEVADAQVFNSEQIQRVKGIVKQNNSFEALYRYLTDMTQKSIDRKTLKIAEIETTKEKTLKLHQTTKEKLTELGRLIPNSLVLENKYFNKLNAHATKLMNALDNLVNAFDSASQQMSAQPTSENFETIEELLKEAQATIEKLKSPIIENRVLLEHSQEHLNLFVTSSFTSEATKEKLHALQAALTESSTAFDAKDFSTLSPEIQLNAAEEMKKVIQEVKTQAEELVQRDENDLVEQLETQQVLLTSLVDKPNLSDDVKALFKQQITFLDKAKKQLMLSDFKQSPANAFETRYDENYFDRMVDIANTVKIGRGILKNNEVEIESEEQPANDVNGVEGNTDENEEDMQSSTTPSISASPAPESDQAANDAPLVGQGQMALSNAENIELNDANLIETLDKTIELVKRFDNYLNPANLTLKTLKEHVEIQAFTNPLTPRDKEVFDQLVGELERQIAFQSTLATNANQQFTTAVEQALIGIEDQIEKELLQKLYQIQAQKYATNTDFNDLKLSELKAVPEKRKTDQENQTKVLASLATREAHIKQLFILQRTTRAQMIKDEAATEVQALDLMQKHFVEIIDALGKSESLLPIAFMLTNVEKELGELRTEHEAKKALKAALEEEISTFEKAINENMDLLDEKIEAGTLPGEFKSLKKFASEIITELHTAQQNYKIAGWAKTTVKPLDTLTKQELAKHVEDIRRRITEQKTVFEIFFNAIDEYTEIRGETQKAIEVFEPSLFRAPLKATEGQELRRPLFFSAHTLKKEDYQIQFSLGLLVEKTSNLKSFKYLAAQVQEASTKLKQNLTRVHSSIPIEELLNQLKQEKHPEIAAKIKQDVVNETKELFQQQQKWLENKKAQFIKPIGIIKNFDTTARSNSIKTDSLDIGIDPSTFQEAGYFELREDILLLPDDKKNAREMSVPQLSAYYRNVMKGIERSKQNLQELISLRQKAVDAYTHFEQAYAEIRDQRSTMNTSLYDAEKELLNTSIAQFNRLTRQHWDLSIENQEKQEVSQRLATREDIENFTKELGGITGKLISGKVRLEIQKQNIARLGKAINQVETYERDELTQVKIANPAFATQIADGLKAKKEQLETLKTKYSIPKGFLSYIFGDAPEKEVTQKREPKQKVMKKPNLGFETILTKEPFETIPEIVSKKKKKVPEPKMQSESELGEVEGSAQAKTIRELSEIEFKQWDQAVSLAVENALAPTKQTGLLSFFKWS